MVIGMHVVMINPSLVGVFVPHSAFEDPTKPGRKVSKVWTDIATGAVAAAEQYAVDLTVLSPDAYHDPDEHISQTEQGVDMNPDALALPFTPIGDRLRQEKFLRILDRFEGKIIAVNVPPDQAAIERLGDKFLGYVGMDEVRAGETIAWQLLRNSGRPPAPIYILEHERDHYAFRLREQGIRNVAACYGIEDKHIKTLYVGTDEQPVTLSTDAKCYVVYLGVKGFKAASGLDPNQVLGLGGVDLDDEVAGAILSHKVDCTVIQHPWHQGFLAIESMLRPRQEKPFIRRCGPTLVNLCNVEVMAKPHNVRVFSQM